MKEINEILRKNNISGCEYKKNGKCIIISTKDNKIVLRPNKTNIYEYLSYRSFNNIPSMYIDSGYEFIDYIEEIDIPVEQKMIELINVVSILHKKTTYYKKISEMNIDNIHDEIINKINSIKEYYDRLMYEAENTIYMSPSQYLLARNISNVYNAINYCNNNIEKWYSNIKKTDRVRVSVLHNNLKLEHFINNILINWDESKIGIPVFDLYKLYNNTYNEYDWNELLKIYNHNFSIKKDEILLFNVLISIPIKVNITNIEIDNVRNMQEVLNYIKLTNDFIAKRKDEIMKKSEIQEITE